MMCIQLVFKWQNLNCPVPFDSVGPLLSLFARAEGEREKRRDP